MPNPAAPDCRRLRTHQGEIDADAWAGTFDGTLFDASFTPKTALALADPTEPGRMTIVVLPEATTCDQARRIREGTAKKRPAAMVLAVFDAWTAGATATHVLAVGTQGLGAFDGTATLGSVPAAVGERAALRVDLMPVKETKHGPMGPLGASSPGDRLEGEVQFELCDTFAARPSLSPTKALP